MVVMSALLIPAMICRFYQGWFQMLLIDVPLFTASTFSIAVFYVMSQRELFPKTWKKTFYYLPFLMALGIGLTVTNTKAVMEALFGIKSAFVRTPKYRVAQKGEKSQAAKYRKRLKLAPWIELLLGCYFAGAIFYTFTNHNYFTAPFLILFVIGYWYTGLDEPAAGPLRALAHRRRTPTNPAPSRSRLACDGDAAAIGTSERMTRQTTSAAGARCTAIHSAHFSPPHLALLATQSSSSRSGVCLSVRSAL